MAFARLLTLAEDGALGLAVSATLERLVAGFGLSVILGTLVGLLMANFRRFGKTMSSFCLGLQSFPSIAWVTVCNPDNWSERLWTPFRHADELRLFHDDLDLQQRPEYPADLSQGCKEHGGQESFPAEKRDAPRLDATDGHCAQTDLVFSWHALIGAEMLFGISVGLGELLYYGSEFAEMNQVIATMIVIFAIGFVADRLIFQRLEDSVR